MSRLARTVVRRRSNEAFQLAAVALVVAGCSGAPKTVSGSATVAPSGAATGTGTGISAGTLTSASAAGSGAPSGAAPSAGSITSTNPTHDSTRAPRYPSPAGMQPPTATAATAVGCEPLTGGGWRATFLVTLTGGEQWAVVPELGPATPTGHDVWKVVIEESTVTSNSVTLSRVKVGGGAPFRTAYVPLGPGLAPTASCPS